MSSEAEALRDADRAASEFYREWWKPKASDKRLTELRARYNDTLIEYRTAIERRVLAQQPTRVHLAHDERCETCNDVAAWMAKISRARIARQTQETSG